MIRHFLLTICTLLVAGTAWAGKKPVYMPLPDVMLLSSPPATAAKPTRNLAELQAAAASFTNRLTLPEFETTPAQIQSSLAACIAACNAALDRVAAGPADAVTFANTIGAMDEIAFTANLFANRLSLIKESSPDATVREAATEAVKK